MHEQSSKEQMRDQIMSQHEVQDMDPHERNALAKDLKDKNLTELELTLHRLSNQ